MLDRLLGSWSSPQGSMTQVEGGKDEERLGKRSPMQRPEWPTAWGQWESFLDEEPYLPGSCPPEALSLGMMTGCPGKVLGGFKPPAAVIEQCFNPLQKGLRCAWYMMLVPLNTLTPRNTAWLWTLSLNLYQHPVIWWFPSVACNWWYSARKALDRMASVWGSQALLRVSPVPPAGSSLSELLRFGGETEDEGRHGRKGAVSLGSAPYWELVLFVLLWAGWSFNPCRKLWPGLKHLEIGFIPMEIEKEINNRDCFSCSDVPPALCKYRPILAPNKWFEKHSLTQSSLRQALPPECHFLAPVWVAVRPFATAAKSLQSCPTLCSPRDGSPSGSPWDSPGKNTAISFSNAWKWKVKVKSLSRVRLLVTPWSGVPLPYPTDGMVTIINNIVSYIYWILEIC